MKPKHRDLTYKYHRKIEFRLKPWSASMVISRRLSDEDRLKLGCYNTSSSWKRKWPRTVAKTLFSTQNQSSKSPPKPIPISVQPFLFVFALNWFTHPNIEPTRASYKLALMSRRSDGYRRPAWLHQICCIRPVEADGSAQNKDIGLQCARSSQHQC